MATRAPEIYKGGFIDPLIRRSRYDALNQVIEDAQDIQKGYLRFTSTIYDVNDEGINKIIESRSSDGVWKSAGQLRPYQTYGVKFILTAKSALVTDSVGLGKTAIVSSVINNVRALKEKQLGEPFRFLFFTEVGLVEQARRELVRFTGSYVTTTTGAAGLVGKFQEEVGDGSNFFGVVASYSAVSKSYDFNVWMHQMVKQYGRFDYMFIDEGSILGSPRSDMTKAFKNVRKNFVNNVVVMNATPFEKTIESMYHQLDFVFPDAIPTKTKFEELFVQRNFQTREITGYKDPDSFKEAVKYMVFGTARKELEVSVRGSTCELVMYRPSSVQLQMLPRTKYKNYVWDDPSWLDPALEVDGVSNPKLKALGLVLKERVGASRAMVYCKYVEAQATLVRYLEGLGYKVLTINGEDNTPKKKAQKLEKFKTEGYQIIVTNLKKGLNLGFINHLIFYSFSGNSGLMAQIEGRIVRSQSIHDKHLYLLMASSHEYNVLEEVHVNTVDRLVHTKDEVSLLNNFLADKGILMEMVEECKKQARTTEPFYAVGLLFDDDKGVAPVKFNPKLKEGGSFVEVM